MATASEGRQQPRASGPETVEELTRRNVERVLALEAVDQKKATTADRVAGRHYQLFRLHQIRLDHYPDRGRLGGPQSRAAEGRPDRSVPLPAAHPGAVGGAIFLAILILMSQNRAARISEKRSQLDLQLTMLSEQENTKMLLMLQQIGQAVGAETGEGADLVVLTQATQPEALSEQIDRAAEASQRPDKKP